MEEERGTLKLGEFHPASISALKFVKSLDLTELSMWLESFSSCAIEGNRLAEICSETLNRVMKGEPVSDRYLLGLAWTLRNTDKAYKEIKVMLDALQVIVLDKKISKWLKENDPMAFKQAKLAIKKGKKNEK